MAERDRRAGRIDLAVASLGDATEWPARVILALARLSDDEARETRRILEEGLDVWAEEVGLDSLDSPVAVEAMLEEARLDGFGTPGAETADSGSEAESDLERPIDNNELERAFAEAEAQTDEMHDVNQVAERVLMSESAGLAALSGDDLVPSYEPDDASDDRAPDVFGMDAAEVPETISASENPATSSSRTSSTPFVDVVSNGADFAGRDSADAQEDSQPPRDRVLATLTRWLENIEDGRARRAQ